eukprot:1149738-Pelagomonas_calceolata.AAC.2
MEAYPGQGYMFLALYGSFKRPHTWVNGPLLSVKRIREVKFGTCTFGHTYAGSMQKTGKIRPQITPSADMRMFIPTAGPPH